MKWLAVFCMAPALLAQDPQPPQIRAAAVRSLALLEKGAAGFAKAQDCFSCHNTGLPAGAFAVARERGIPVNETVARAALTKPLSKTLGSIDRTVQANLIIDPASSDAAALIAAHNTGLKPNLTTAIAARQIASAQRADGHWSTIDERPPQGHSPFSSTAVAVRALQLYMPEELRKEAASRAQRAKEWLLKAAPATTEDFTFRLNGLVWAGAPQAERAGALRDLQGLQRANGGWGQLPRMEPDAYATGEALVALHEAGVPETDTAWRKGLRYLMSTQNPDGSWRVRTRMISPAQVSPPYFESGFPFGHDQFISSAATSYAVTALMLALPKAAKPAPAPGLPEVEPKSVQPWMRTAAFGSTAELKALLDKGLDANSRTGDGTTLLMLAMPSAEKAALLIERGADVKAKAKSGFTAVMVASLYRGSGDALRELFAKGADAAPAAGVMFNASPLVLAVYAGDVSSIALLREHHAEVNRKMMLIGAFPTTPLGIAVALNDLETIKTLIAAGADLKEHDADGLSLMHMAVLPNHTEAAQALIDAGVPVNQADKHGFTPLMYASTIDYGDDRMVKLLLRAGADAKARGKAGETALSQARKFQYPHIEKALQTAGAQE